MERQRTVRLSYKAWIRTCLVPPGAPHLSTSSKTPHHDDSIKFVVLPHIHSKLRSITHVVTKVHVILKSFVVLTWMFDIIKLV